MRHRAALAGAALALGVFALTAGPGSAATVEILSLVDAGCCSIFRWFEVRRAKMIRPAIP